jgi:tetratricopeptide (TPR) repeat protein
MAPTLRALGLAALLLGFAAALSLGFAERDLARPYDVAYVPSSGAVRAASLGQRLLLSDLYWLSTVQYIGEKEGLAAQRGWVKLFPLLDLVTDLDPRHGYAYQTGGIVLSVAGLLDESDAILKKGIEKGPPYWSFGYYLAFNAWFYRGDYETAAHWAEVAARTPGASPNISQLALSLASKSGKPEQAIELLDELMATVKDEEIRARLDEQRKLAVLERDAQAIERAIKAYSARTGLPVTHLSQLLVSGLLARLPADPFGGEYTLDPGDGRVHSSANRFRFSPREGPQKEPRILGEIRPMRPTPGTGREEPRP